MKKVNSSKTARSKDKNLDKNMNNNKMDDKSADLTIGDDLGTMKIGKAHSMNDDDKVTISRKQGDPK